MILRKLIIFSLNFSEVFKAMATFKKVRLPQIRAQFQCCLLQKLFSLGNRRLYGFRVSCGIVLHSSIDRITLTLRIDSMIFEFVLFCSARGLQTFRANRIILIFYKKYFNKILTVHTENTTRQWWKRLNND